MNGGLKPSGVSWLGDIPHDWQTTRIISTYAERSTKVSDKDYPPLTVGKMGVVPQLEHVAKTDDGDNRKLVKKDDFVINSRADRRGACGIAEQDGSVSLINIVLQPLKHVCNRYYSFVFRSERFADEFFRLGNGIVDDLWTTRWYDMKKIYIPMPNETEQEAIADFLGDECGKIDAIVADMENQIEILQTYRNAVITKAVTKGLDSSALLKNSGVAWIGEMPQAWTISKIKYLATEKGSLFMDGDWIESDIIVEEGIRYLTTGNVWAGEYKEQGMGHITQKTFNKLNCLKVLPGDLVISRLNEPIGRACILPLDKEPFYVVAVDIVVLRPNKSCDKRYLMYFMNTNGYAEEAGLTSRGTTMPRISRTILGNLNIVIPPLNEQQAIADYLDDKCAKIDALIKDKQAAVDTMREYKKSLIYEYVTGKKRVKEAQ